MQLDKNMKNVRGERLYHFIVLLVPLTWCSCLSSSCFSSSSFCVNTYLGHQWFPDLKDIVPTQSHLLLLINQEMHQVFPFSSGMFLWWLITQRTFPQEGSSCCTKAYSGAYASPLCMKREHTLHGRMWESWLLVCKSIHRSYILLV